MRQERKFQSNTWAFYSSTNSPRRFSLKRPGANNKATFVKACEGHLVSEAIGLLLVLSQLLLPLLHAAVGLLQRRHQLGIAVLQGEELSLQVDLTHGPEHRTGGGSNFRAFANRTSSMAAWPLLCCSGGIWVFSKRQLWAFSTAKATQLKWLHADRVFLTHRWAVKMLHDIRLWKYSTLKTAASLFLCFPECWWRKWWRNRGVNMTLSHFVWNTSSRFKKHL